LKITLEQQTTTCETWGKLHAWCITCSTVQTIHKHAVMRYILTYILYMYTTHTYLDVNFVAYTVQYTHMKIEFNDRWPCKQIYSNACSPSTIICTYCHACMYMHHQSIHTCIRVISERSCHILMHAILAQSVQAESAQQQALPWNRAEAYPWQRQLQRSCTCCPQSRGSSHLRARHPAAASSLPTYL